MPYWKCYYHIIWATKGRASLIVPRAESLIMSVIGQKAEEMGCQVLACNGMPDHIHVALSVPPHIAIAKLIGQVKGISSHAVNKELLLNDSFQWQESYGVLTFGERALPFVHDYIANQKQRHAERNLNSYLERIE